MKLVKELEFASAHRLWKYDGLCRNVHGHNYKVHIVLNGKNSAEDGILLDFKKVKEVAKTWLDENWEHATMVHPSDETFLAFLQEEGQRFWVFPEELPNPTAENIARVLFEVLEGKLPPNLLDAVRIYETPTSYAEWSRRDY